MKKDYTTLKLLAIYLIGILILVLMSGCGPTKPDYVDENGKEYVIMEHCIKSHSVTEFGYGYGYDYRTGKHGYHSGTFTRTICDEYGKDTIEINKNKKYYAKNRKSF